MRDISDTGKSKVSDIHNPNNRQDIHPKSTDYLALHVFPTRENPGLYGAGHGRTDPNWYEKVKQELGADKVKLVNSRHNKLKRKEKTNKEEENAYQDFLDATSRINLEYRRKKDSQADSKQAHQDKVHTGESSHTHHDSSSESDEANPPSKDERRLPPGNIYETESYKASRNAWFSSSDWG